MTDSSGTALDDDEQLDIASDHEEEVAGTNNIEIVMVTMDSSLSKHALVLSLVRRRLLLDSNKLPQKYGDTAGGTFEW